ncbi:radical SAM protein [Siccirubricoccus sp. KC 17139]|uniref:Radical SAM protein n=1 Tax=Siccirubricoccus soli TaxID=2899147 RepID=A0ABT1CYC5_9PROT|nr:radical SAM protein [Siccirubricoccus soli]MCO6414665.1 radical SAM protein [Siccirubricoccus soli]MCP2680795.1 radical SAM protein [Siccirubricoccus soli]
MSAGPPKPPHRNPVLERPLKVTLSFTDSCNLNCRHCYADCSATPKPDELSAAEWCGILDRLEADGVIGLYIEGGEPLHRPDFLDVLRHAAGRFHIQLRTHGTLVTPEMAAVLRQECRIATLLVDIMGPDAATHDATTGVPGSFERATAGITAALAAGIDTQMLTIMTRWNVAGLQGWVDLAARLGVATVGILRPYPLGRLKRRWAEASLSLDEMHAALEALRLPPGMRLMQSWHPNNGNCCWQTAAIDARGNSIGCAYLREYVHLGNLREVAFLDTWNHPLHRELRSGAVTEACGDCASSQGSHGGCRSTAFAFHGRWDAPDPFDRATNNGVDLRVLPKHPV